jgi:hypothetical protein
MPPVAFTVSAQALYSSSAGTLKTPNAEPEQLQMKPTLIGAAVACADDGLADEALPTEEVAEVEFDEEDLLLDEQAATSRASATTPPTIDQPLRLRLITLDLLHPTGRDSHREATG